MDPGDRVHATQSGDHMRARLATTGHSSYNTSLDMQLISFGISMQSEFSFLRFSGFHAFTCPATIATGRGPSLFLDPALAFISFKRGAICATGTSSCALVPRFLYFFTVKLSSMSECVRQPSSPQLRTTHLDSAYRECEKVNFMNKSFVNTRSGLFSEQRPGTCIGGQHICARTVMKCTRHTEQY